MENFTYDVFILCIPNVYTYLHLHSYMDILLRKSELLISIMGGINEYVNPSFSIDLDREINLPLFSLLFQRLIREKVQYKSFLWSETKKSEI